MSNHLRCGRRSLFARDGFSAFPDLNSETLDPCHLPGRKRKKERRCAHSLRYALRMEPIFEVRQAEEGGGYVARALGQAIFTEAEIWQGLRENVMEVTSPHF